jgi:hypothetical protein
MRMMMRVGSIFYCCFALFVVTADAEDNGAIFNHPTQSTNNVINQSAKPNK